MDHKSNPILDHETALRYRIPNADTLDVYHLLTTDHAAWTREQLSLDIMQRLTFAEQLYNAAANNHPMVARIDLDCVRWSRLYRALDRWQERHGWKVTGNE